MILGNFSSDDYIKRSIIEPSKNLSAFETDLKKTRIVIDSRIRDTNLFPTPNTYDMPFDDDINDVTTARLIYADIPMNMYLVNSNFNSIIFNVSSVDYTCILTNGDYTPEELAIELQTRLSAISPVPITVTYVKLTDNFSFSCASEFQLKFADSKKSLNLLLGFKNQTYISTLVGSVNVIKSIYRKNFNYNNYLIMDIEQFDTIKSTDRDLNKSFALIPKNYTQLNIIDTFDYVKYFSPPIAKVAKLQIKFYDRFGNLYDFQNMDHRFELLFEHHRQRRKYNN